MKRLAIALVLILCGLCSAQQELTSGSTDEYVYFIAVDSTDYHTRETDLVAGDFTVYYSINGGAATAMTTPTIAEVSKANMPGEYSLLVDEAGITTLGATKDQANVIFSISHASIDRVTLSAVVKRTKITAGQTVTAANGAAEADLTYAHGSAITEAGGAGRLAASISTWGNVATPAATAASVNQSADAYVPALAAQTAAEKIDTSTELRTLLVGSDTALATASNLTTVDTVVDAIKAKTDNLPATPLGLTTVVDGTITAQDALQMLIAWASGKIVIVDNGSTRTISCYKRDGATVKFSYTASEVDGSRPSTGTIN